MTRIRSASASSASAAPGPGPGPGPGPATTHRPSRSRAGRLVSAAVGIGLALGIAASAVPSAQALTAVSHGIGYSSPGDGRWLGSYRLDDGRLGFCIDVGLAAPPGHAYAPVDDAGRSADDRARLAYIAREWAGSSDPDTAAAGQLATWSITGLGGHDLGWYAARAGDRAGVVEARAREMLAETDSAAGASRSVTAAASAVLGDDGRGTVRVDLRADFLATGPASVPAGTRTGTVQLEGATFADGSTTARVADGVDTAIRATGSDPTLHVHARVVFADLPYGDALDVVGDGGASQGLVLARPADARADAEAEATTPNPLPFAPRVETHASSAVAHAGDVVTDALHVTADPAAGSTPVSAGWGTTRRPDGGLRPVPVVVRSRLLGPFPEQVGPERDDVPVDAPEVCRVATLVDHGPGDYVTPPCTLPSGGYYTWVTSIAPEDTSVADGRSRVLPWRSTFGSALETTQVPHPPTIDTTVAAQEVLAGACQTDTLHVTSFAGTGPVPVRVRLAGPFASTPTDGAPVSPSDLAGATGRSAEVTLTDDGDMATPCIPVDAPGWYVAVLDSPGRPASDADGAAVAPFSDMVAHASETFHASPPPPVAQVTPPARHELAMTGGAPGITAPMRWSAPQLAIGASVLGLLGAAGVGLGRTGRRRASARASRWARS
ncbi:hypothetical protein [Clavibacter tessellarius]|uniref:Uncharacterized protein n=1 Tax=Clavibacter tessellarius TaxID=31965 RepID=A0A154V3D5_9MICO|nr:hypothetical protein [Clavibacter michiganensis]KZC95871.1 hypothetical protein AWH51_05990 [Clavibacter michiganensis subsp. tessellarius]